MGAVSRRSLPQPMARRRMATELLHQMKRDNARYGVVSMCIGGGMGAAAVFEREN